MAGTGRIYRRGHIYYIAYRWDSREGCVATVADGGW